MSDTDLELLARYARGHAEDAFAELVRRHVNLVHSAALRQVRSPQLAEEVAQSTFLKLARQAGQFRPDTVLAAWLYQVTRREAVDVVRREARRQMREQIAVQTKAMNTPDVEWNDVEPWLDEAMGELDETDRAAVLLRFFENKSLREVGAALGASDDAAQKRVSRAVERLREFFGKRGVAVGATGLAAAISANAVQAAPVGLAQAISATVSLAVSVSASGVVATQTTTLAMKILTFKTIAVIASTAAITGAATYLVQKQGADRLRGENQILLAQKDQLAAERDAALAKAAAHPNEADNHHDDNMELLRLRGEVGALKNQLAQASQLAANNQPAAAKATELSAAEREKQAALLRQQSIAKLNYSRNWAFAFIKYAEQNGGQIPASFDQATNYLDDQAREETLLATNQFEILYHGPLNAIANPENTIILRESQAVQGNNGWLRTYAFADGHSEVHRSEDGDFSSWEQSRLPPSAGVQ